MKHRFIKTDNEELISNGCEHLNGEEINVTSIGVIRHRSQLKTVIDDIAFKLQGHEEDYNTFSAPYRRAMFLMNACDESAMLGQFDKAISSSTEAAQYFPFMIEALRGIADSNFSLGKFDEAVKAYNRLIELYTNLPDIHYQLGRCYFELGKNDQAIQAFEREMQISGEAADIYLQIGSIRFSEAMDIYNSLYDSGERNLSVLFSKCGTLLQAAKQSFEKGVRVDPKSDELHQLLQQVSKVLKGPR